MIHYTLLPKKEMKTLQREYWIRLLVVSIFFISCAVVLGIITLIPSYVYTQVQERQALLHKDELLKSRKESGADQVEKSLVESQTIAQKIIEDSDMVAYSDIVQKIISHRSNQILLSGFGLSHGEGTSTPTQIVVQGGAVTREALLNFKKGLDNDTSFTHIDLPLSDLAKSKNITFTVQMTLNKKP
jgi:hypothetical protein